MLDPSCLSWAYAPRLCEALVRQECEVHLVTSRFLYGKSEEPISYDRWNHFYNRTIRLYAGRTVGFFRRYVKGTEHVVDMFRVLRLLRVLQPDMIHYQQAPIPFIDRWFLGAFKRIAPVVSTVHNSTAFHGDASWLQRWGFGSMLRRFDHLMVHTEYSRQLLIEGLGIPSYRVSVLPGGLYDHYESAAEREPTCLAPEETETEQIILYFGNISYYKGLDILIRAFGQLPKARLSQARLLVVGNPRMPMEPIRTLAKEVGIEDRVTWDLRFIPEEEVHSVFSRATVVALPYRQIDRSGVLTTALSYGKPIIATRVGGFAEMLQDGVHGYLVDPGDPSEMAARMEDLLSDASRARAMGDAVRQLAKGWRSWDNVAQDLVQIYQELNHRRQRWATQERS